MRRCPAEFARDGGADGENSAVKFHIRSALIGGNVLLQKSGRGSGGKQPVVFQIPRTPEAHG